MKKQGIIYLVIGVLFFLLVGAFYWFQLRPTNIRKECYKNISELDKKYDIYQQDYEKCLRSKGL